MSLKKRSTLDFTEKTRHSSMERPANLTVSRTPFLEVAWAGELRKRPSRSN